MINSKAIKPKRKLRFQIEEEAKNFLQNAVFLFKKWFIWPVTDNFRWIKERTKRSFAYARFGWHNYDFDFAYVYYLLEFKLKRLRHCLRTGLSVQEPEDMAALRELIKIVSRLGNGQYDDKYLKEHDKKWGKIETRTEPYSDENGKRLGSTWVSWRKKCPENASKKVKERERKEFLACYSKGEQDRIKDVERMCEILIKNSPKFWD